MGTEIVYQLGSASAHQDGPDLLAEQVFFYIFFINLYDIIHWKKLILKKHNNNSNSVLFFFLSGPANLSRP